MTPIKGEFDHIIEMNTLWLAKAKVDTVTLQASSDFNIRTLKFQGYMPKPTLHKHPVVLYLTKSHINHLNLELLPNSHAAIHIYNKSSVKSIHVSIPTSTCNTTHNVFLSIYQKTTPPPKITSKNCKRSVRFVTTAL